MSLSTLARNDSSPSKSAAIDASIWTFSSVFIAGFIPALFITSTVRAATSSSLKGPYVGGLVRKHPRTGHGVAHDFQE